MRRHQRLAEAVAPGGGTITLARDGEHYLVAVDGAVLMASEEHASEEVLARNVCARLAGRKAPRVAIGGLGMGFTVRAALDTLPPDARVTVVEFLPALVEWNRTLLAPLAGAPLQDPRVSLELTDFSRWLHARPGPFDALLLDLDNGPEAFTTPANAWLYAREGLLTIREALVPQGLLGVWSSHESPVFEKRMRGAGFVTEVVRVRSRPNEAKGLRHTLFIGALPRAAASRTRRPAALRTRDA